MTMKRYDVLIKQDLLPDPLAELQGVGHGGAQQDDANMVRQHDQHLLPHHASLGTGRSLAGH